MMFVGREGGVGGGGGGRERERGGGGAICFLSKRLLLCLNS